MNRTFLSKLMKLAWQFVRRNGYTMSEAMKAAWANMKLRLKFKSGITKFYFLKVDGSIREAFGTLDANLVPETKGDDRQRNDTVQTYFDTERQEWRCFKKANLLRLA